MKLNIFVLANFLVLVLSHSGYAKPWDDKDIKNLVLSKYGQLPIAALGYEAPRETCVNLTGTWERKSTDAGDQNSPPYFLNIEQIGCEAVFIDESGSNAFGHFFPGLNVTFLQNFNNFEFVANTVAFWRSDRELIGTHMMDFIMAMKIFVQLQWDIKVDDDDDDLIYLKLHQSEFGSLDKQVVFEGYYSKL